MPASGVKEEGSYSHEQKSHYQEVDGKSGGKKNLLRECFGEGNVK